MRGNFVSYLPYLFIFLSAYCGSEGRSSSTFYAENSLSEAGSAFPFANPAPSGRVHHSLALSHPYLLVYGGYDRNGSTLGDAHLYHLPSQRWSGPITRWECCNEEMEPVNLIGFNAESLSDVVIADIKPGFEGDEPLPRAEHGTCGLQGAFYLFGGYSGHNFSSQHLLESLYLNDLYRFDPLLLSWSVLSVKGGSGVPARRAGHATACADNGFYIFGGRSSTSSSSIVALADVWFYDAEQSLWTLLFDGGDANSPMGREHSALAVQEEKLFLYGGRHPASGFVFNDLWSFDTSLHSWEELSHSSVPSWSYAFAPPGLIGSTLLPMGSFLLLYGGMGAGGMDSHIDPLQSALGQVYSFSFEALRWIGPLIDVNDLDEVAREAQNQTAQWVYGRLSSAIPSSMAYRKEYALEESFYDSARGILYEFGGVKDRAAAALLDSGAQIPAAWADVETGEGLKDHVELPSNNFWDARSIWKGNNELFMFQTLRMNLVNRISGDIVLTMEDNPS
eukprot:gene2190-2390_t